MLSCSFSSKANKLLLLLLLLLLCAVSNAQTVQTSSRKHGEQESLEVEAAFNMFSIVVANEYNSMSSGRLTDEHVVFKDGGVTDMWIEPTSSDPQNSSTIPGLYHDNEYADRISFDFFYGKFQNYDITIPTCTSSDDSIAKPKILEFQNEQKDQSGSFSVVYDCQRSPSPYLLRNATISVVFPVASGLSILFQFRKTCGGGDHQYIEFGYYQQSENNAKESSRKPFTKGTNPIIVGPHVMNTKLYLHLSAPAKVQEFFHVSLKSSDRSMTVTPKGPVFGGVLTQSESSIIHALYECHGEGRHQVLASIPVNPFNTLHASWVKDCGGGLASGFNVGSEVSIRDDVVKSGASGPRWEVKKRAKSDKLRDDVPFLNASIHAKDFWLSNDGFPLQVAPPVTTVEKPSILAAIAPESYSQRFLNPRENTGVIPQGEKMRCRIRLVCKRKGSSMVTVIFPFKSFTNVEVSFMKECRAPRRYVRSGFLRTASSVMIVMSVLMLAALSYYGKRQCGSETFSSNEKPAPGYRPV